MSLLGSRVTCFGEENHMSTIEVLPARASSRSEPLPPHPPPLPMPGEPLPDEPPETPHPEPPPGPISPLPPI
jgi:hypothetical protein